MLSGGPLETIQDGVTGYLRPPNPHAWADVIHELVLHPDVAVSMGKAARQRVEEQFSRSHHIDQLEEALYQLVLPISKKK